MQQRSLGATGLKVSRLGLGTMTWGRDTDEHEARDQLIAFAEAGGTLRRHRRRLRRRRVRGADRHAASATSSPATRSCSPPRPASAPAHGRSASTDASRGHLLTHPRRVAEAARRRPRRPVAGAHLGRRHPARGDAVARSTTRSPPAGRRTSASPTTPAGRPRRPPPGSAPCPAGRRWPRRRSSTPCSTATSSTRSLPARQALGPRRAPLVAAGPRGADREVPHRHPVGLPGGVPALRELRRAPTSTSARRGIVEAVARAADGLGWSPARGGPGLGARPARRDRADRRRPHRRAARGALGVEELDPARRDRRGPRRRVRRVT